MNPQSFSNLLSQTQKFVSEYMSRFDSSHDYAHVVRVVHLAQQIARNESAMPSDAHSGSAAIYDFQLVTLAALLHDVGDKKYLRSDEEGTTLVRNILIAVEAPLDLAQSVQEVVNAVSYSGEVKDSCQVARVLSRHPELGPVQDADRMDAIGAIGIGRCFTFRGAKAGNTGDTAIKHFDEKLLRLESMMKTETGRKMAKARTERLSMFQKWYLEEAQAEEGSVDLEESAMAPKKPFGM